MQNRPDYLPEEFWDEKAKNKIRRSAGRSRFLIPFAIITGMILVLLVGMVLGFVGFLVTAPQLPDFWGIDKTRTVIGSTAQAVQATAQANEQNRLFNEVQAAELSNQQAEIARQQLQMQANQDATQNAIFAANSQQATAAVQNYQATQLALNSMATQIQLDFMGTQSAISQANSLIATPTNR